MLIDVFLLSQGKSHSLFSSICCQQWGNTITQANMSAFISDIYLLKAFFLSLLLSIMV